MRSSDIGLTIALCWIASVATGLAQLSVGETSKDLSLGVFDSSGDLTSRNLYDSAGKIVVAFFYTPW